VNGFAERTTLAYDSLGRETSRVLGNGVTSSRQYDAAGRETVISHAKSDGTLLALYTASYDAASNRTAVQELDGSIVTYVQDASNQLTGEQRSGPNAYRTTYSYDGVGNRLSKQDGTGTTSYQYNVANELTLVTPPSGPPTTMSWDAKGNLAVENTGGALTSGTWNGENRLLVVASPTGTETYTYSDDGLRQKKVTGSGTVYYVLDGQNVLVETDGSLITQAVYADLPGIWGAKFSLRRSGASHFCLPDHQGNSRQLADSSQAVTDTLLTDAWGVHVATAGSTANPFEAFGQ
jgi:YD repeat-containing protein